MSPVRSRKRKSEASPSTSPQRSPIKRRKLGVTLAQKQALIDNLQLEITERARRLRAQYNIQAQQLRSRVEMRVNRIPTTLRKLRMRELPAKSYQPHYPRPAPRSQYVLKPPPVPAKDGTSPKPIPRKPLPAASPARGHKRLSNEISGSDKENQGDIDNPKKRLRTAATQGKAPITASQVLSPTSSNTRILPRDRPASPMKSIMGRPASPVKVPTTKASSNILSSIVERATTTATTATGRTRKAAARPPSAATTRGKRKVSVTSESSEGSTTTTIVKKSSTASRATKAAPKKTVMNTIKSAITKKAPAAKAAPATAATSRTGRTLRKRA
ncbi:Borealin N terminal-domain-containing protein [Xylaria scruposa]|nr:Borealin N terminal-domain-containing protein [Xylaria scruposa]